MAISWGSWEYSGGNGMRVGIEASVASVSHSSSSCKVTFKIYTDNQYSYSDSQSLNISGTGGWGDVGFTNNDGSSAVLRATKTYTYDFDANDYGSGTAKNVTLTAALSGAYNGVTPSKSVTVSIPKRPYAAPAAPTGQALTRTGETTASATWVNHATAGEPYSTIYARHYNSLTGWSGWYSLGVVTSWALSGLAAGRAWSVQIYANNPASNSGIAQTGMMQTRPIAPSACTVEKNGVNGTIVRWVNNQTTSGYYFTNHVQRQHSTDGGATWSGWVTIGTAVSTASSYSDAGLTPGYVYQYQVIAQSTVGGTLDSAPATSDTIQLQQVPADPTGLTLTRGSDTSFTLNWANHPDGDLAPYNAITVQRWDNVSNTWATVASLDGAAVTLTDTTTSVNHRYQWRVRAENAAGPSAWVLTSFTQTTPTAPTISKVRAVAGGGVRIEWLNNVSYSAYSIGVRYYKNGVLVTDTVSLAAGETGYTVTPADLAAKYKFSVRAVSTVGATLDSGWVESAEIDAATVPNAPTLLTPNGSVVDLARDLTFAWQHNPSLDASEQTKFEIQFSDDDGATWGSLGVIEQDENSWIMPAGTLPNGVDYLWQIRTWGVHATASAWSASATMPTSTTPVVTINYPPSTLTISMIDVAWSYFDTEGSAQSGWEVRLLDGDGNLVETHTGSDAFTTSLTLETAAQDGSSYTLRVRVRDASGLWSDWAELSLIADFIPPAPSILTADYSAGNGFVVLTLTPTEPEA